MTILLISGKPRGNLEITINKKRIIFYIKGGPRTCFLHVGERASGGTKIMQRPFGLAHMRPYARGPRACPRDSHVRRDGIF